MTRPLGPVPFSYYGGKHRLAERIVALIPPHRVYVEPFAGSLAVLLAKPRAPIEVINDLDGDIVRFWRALRDHPDELSRACLLTPYSRAEHQAAADRTDCDDVEAARRWWVRLRQSVTEISRSTTGWSTSTCHDRPGQSWRAALNMPAIAARIRLAYIECRDAAEVIANWDAPDAVHYVDPPYLGATRRKPGDGYAVDMTDPAAHERLAATLNAAQGVVLLSGYPHPLYDALYAGWQRYEIPSRLLAGQALQVTQKGLIEVVWVNRTTYAQPELFLETETPPV